MQFMLGLHKMICKYCGNWIPPQHAGCFVCGKPNTSDLTFFYLNEKNKNRTTQKREGKVWYI